MKMREFFGSRLGAGDTDTDPSVKDIEAKVKAGQNNMPTGGKGKTLPTFQPTNKVFPSDRNILYPRNTNSNKVSNT